MLMARSTLSDMPATAERTTEAPSCERATPIMRSTISRASVATYCSHSASVIPRRFVTRVARMYSSAPRDIALTVSSATSSVVSPIRTIAVALASRTVAMLVKARAKRAGGRSLNCGSITLITPSIAARWDWSFTKFGAKKP